MRRFSSMQKQIITPCLLLPLRVPAASNLTPGFLITTAVIALRLLTTLDSSSSVIFTSNRLFCVQKMCIYKKLFKI